MAKNQIQTFTVKEAAAYMDKDPQYVRQLLHKESLAGEKTVIAGTDMPQWRITQAACDAYLAKSSARQTSQTGSGKAYKIRVKAEDFAEVKSLLESRGIEMVSAYASNYAYQKARKAKLREEKLAAAGQNGASEPVAEIDEELEGILDEAELEDVEA